MSNIFSNFKSWIKGSSKPPPCPGTEKLQSSIPNDSETNDDKPSKTIFKKIKKTFKKKELLSDEEFHRLHISRSERLQKILTNSKTYGSFDIFPQDLLFYLMSFLDLHSVLILSETSQTWCFFLENAQIWRKFVTEESTLGFPDCFKCRAVIHVEQFNVEQQDTGRLDNCFRFSNNNRTVENYVGGWNTVRLGKKVMKKGIHQFAFYVDHRQ